MCFIIFLYKVISNQKEALFKTIFLQKSYGERGGSVVECPTPEREVGGSQPTAAVLCP